MQQNPHAMTGIAVAGLIVVAAGAMSGMQAVLVASPMHVAQFLLVAFLANAGFQALGAAMFVGHLGLHRGLTIGLVSGNRNVTLIWAALGPALSGHPDVELFLAMSVFPIFVMPLATRWLITRMLRPQPSICTGVA